MRYSILKRFLIIPILLVSMFYALPVLAQEGYVLHELEETGKALGMSDDGSVVVGILNVGQAFYWTEEEGIINIGGYEAYDISETGRIVGTFYINNILCPGYYEEGEWNYLGTLENADTTNLNDLGGAFGVSGDGTVIVGMVWLNAGGTQAFKWIEGQGMTGLEPLGNASCRANTIDYDGTIPAGWVTGAGREACKWTPNLVILDETGEVNGMNHDGDIFAGSYGGEGCVWYPDGSRVDIGLLPSHTRGSWAFDISENGIVAGASQEAVSLFTLEAIIWSEANGMQSVEDICTDAGFDVTAWDMLNCTSISDDGLTICGWGFGPLGGFQPFVLQFPDLIDAPEDLTGEYLGDNEIELNWTDTTDEETGFVLEYHFREIDGTFGDYILVDDAIPANTTSYIFTGESYGFYQFRIAAYDEETQSNWANSNEIALLDPPVAPSGFTADYTLEPLEVLLEWTDESDFEMQYRIEKRYQETEGGTWTDWTLLDTLEANSESYVDDEIEWEYIYGYRICAVNVAGVSDWVEVTVQTTDVADKNSNSLPNELSLIGNYPNPFNSTTQVVYSLSSAGNIEFKVYNIEGKIVYSTGSLFRQTGINHEKISMDQFASGTYLLEMQADGKSFISRIILLK